MQVWTHPAQLRELQWLRCLPGLYRRITGDDVIVKPQMADRNAAMHNKFRVKKESKHAIM